MAAQPRSQTPRKRPCAFSRHSLAAFTAGVVLLDLAVQAVHISNQTALYRIRPEARNRLTAGYMTSYFLGGALGSMAAAAGYSRYGWPGVVAVGAAFSLGGLGFWGLFRVRTTPPCR